MRKMILPALAAAALSVAAPASAQERSFSLGPLWSIGMIDVEDGHFNEYMAWLNGQWRSNQAFAKQQGWLLDYHILDNMDRRPGEPDLYLITRYADFPSRAEIERRDKIMLARMQTTPAGAEQQSAARGKMRKQLGDMTLRELLPAR